MSNISFRHSANLGDLIAALCGIKAVCEANNTKAVIYQHLDVPATYWNNDFHPTQTEGKQVMMNQKMFEMIKPLIEAQSYIQSFEIYTGQQYDIDLDVYRNKINVNMPNMPIQSWCMLAYPDMAADISKEWVIAHYKGHELEKLFGNRDVYKNKIIVAFTERYRNYYIDYFFLKEYQDQLIFSGTPKEHEQFCKKWNLQMEQIEITDFLDLAQKLKAAKFLLSNQTFIWNLATSMQTPRICELSYYAPNCIPFVGSHNYGYYHQGGLTYYFNKLLNL